MASKQPTTNYVTLPKRIGMVLKCDEGANVAHFTLGDTGITCECIDSIFINGSDGEFDPEMLGPDLTQTYNNKTRAFIRTVNDGVGVIDMAFDVLSGKDIEIPDTLRTRLVGKGITDIPTQDIERLIGTFMDKFTMYTRAAHFDEKTTFTSYIRITFSNMFAAVKNHMAKSFKNAANDSFLVDFIDPPARGNTRRERQDILNVVFDWTSEILGVVGTDEFDEMLEITEHVKIAAGGAAAATPVPAPTPAKAEVEDDDGATASAQEEDEAEDTGDECTCDGECTCDIEDADDGSIDDGEDLAHASPALAAAVSEDSAPAAVVAPAAAVVVAPAAAVTIQLVTPTAIRPDGIMLGNKFLPIEDARAAIAQHNQLYGFPYQVPTYQPQVQVKHPTHAMVHPQGQYQVAGAY